MKRIFIYAILLLSLFGCSTSNEKVVDSDKEPSAMGDAKADELQASNDSKQVGDFEISIHVDENLNAIASITYIGDEAKKDIYHGGSIFGFNIFQQDGDFVYEGGMTQPLLTTTLLQNEPHTVTFNAKEFLNLEKGLYEFEAIAELSVDSNDVVGSQLIIPVSKFHSVQ